MKQETIKIRKWQLLRWKGRELADLQNAELVAVGKRAFARQARLEEVLMPPTLSAVKTAAFRGCAHLHRVTLARENAVGLAAEAFRDCAYLREIEGSEMLSVIGNYAFTGCRNLRELRLGRDLRRIGQLAFADCVSLEALTIPSCVEQLGDGCFSGCTELREITLEEGLTGLGAGMFRGAIALRQAPVFPESVREIPKDCFRDCSAIEVLELPGSLRRVGSGAFRGCSRLRQVSLSLGTAEVCTRAFAGWRDLESVALPHSIKKIGFGAFGLGWSRNKIRILADNEYMQKRLRTLLWRCGSIGRVTVVFEGKTLAERKRERHKRSLHDEPTHIS